MRVALSAKNSLSSGNYQGFGLIEILVSMLLLNIGLLGLMGLQTLGLQAERSAFFRTSASLISTDAVERIRANRTEFVASDYSSATSDANDSCFKRAGCSSKALAQTDLHELSIRAAEELPYGVLVICRDDTPSNGTPADHECDGYTYQ
ncbi:type IV pilus modification protein PilV [Gammaproteobacteria bacterium]|nr:type IV pilus modification protein PilV [Gammaproteobacteria bacterium]